MNTRKLKFRAWDKQLNSMHDLAGIIQYKEFTEIHYGVSGFRRCIPNSVVIMQFTGLYDKNGVEIFEGDLLKTHNKGLANPENILAVKYSGSSFVIYNPNCCEVCKNGFGCISNLDEWSDYEVIGNLYETPELLTK